ncbi:hypothetical protein [Candidatus Mycobacterium methanotrophicum]|nr:hypothetical protein [Candidatus Mycobacterium methanotrophicum]
MARAAVVRWLGVNYLMPLRAADSADRPGAVGWRVVDWAGYEAALVLLRNVHRTAVAVFADGGKFRTDPSKLDAFSEAPRNGQGLRAGA